MKTLYRAEDSTKVTVNRVINNSIDTIIGAQSNVRITGEKGKDNVVTIGVEYEDKVFTRTLPSAQHVIVLVDRVLNDGTTVRQDEYKLFADKGGFVVSRL